MEDYDLFSKLKKYTEFGNITQTLYKYRILKHNSTIKNRSTIFERYRNIYRDVLTELEIEITQKNIETHFDFFINPTLSFKIIEYKKWLDFLILQNKKTDTYPQKALEEILNERWTSFFFKLVPLQLDKSLSYFFISRKIPFKQFVYLLKYKTNILIGRK
jgi:hypothetical protein